MNLKREKKGKRKYIIILLVVGAFLIFLSSLNIKEIIIQGNSYYSDEQIKEFTKINKTNNTIAFIIKNKFKPIGDVPFLDKIEIKLDSLNSLHINVYEKKVIGCTQYMGLYLYFDKEGVIVESSSLKREEIIEIQGLEYKRAIMLEQLPVDNPKIYEGILELIQLITKYNLDIDLVVFDNMYNITLISSNIRVKCGQASELHSKISRLEKVLPELEGKTGEIDLKNANKNIIFKEDIKEDTVDEEEKGTDEGTDEVKEEATEEKATEEEITEEVTEAANTNEENNEEGTNQD
ncbi:MAG: ftsQ [Clostridiales bacterium]|jgi:cell division protein FtsQ|nr:ftsQ [Clostridiales bacterium]